VCVHRKEKGHVPLHSHHDRRLDDHTPYPLLQSKLFGWAGIFSAVASICNVRYTKFDAKQQLSAIA
jgi:hypothetical protein